MHLLDENRKENQTGVTDLKISLPPVTEAAALDDRNWFADHPSRRFRARVADSSLWLVRRRRGVLLRTVAPHPFALPGDTDRELAAAWYRAAFPDWSRETAQKWARKALRKGAS